MARTTSFASLLSLLLFLLVPSLLSVSGPLSVSAAVSEPTFDALPGGVHHVDLAARKSSAAKKPPTKPPAQPVKVSATPAKAPPVKTTATPVKVSSAAPLKTSSAAPAKVSPVAPIKASSVVPAKASSAPVKASSTVAPGVSSKVTATSASKAKASSTFSGVSASASATSAPACAIKRAGTAGVAAAAACNTCDPCDDSCDTNVQELSTRKRAVLPQDDESDIRTIYGNDTTPFLPGEHVRIRIVEKRVNPVLEFDCSPTGIPDVCQNMCFGIFCQNHPQTLTRNSASKPACAAARTRNSCGQKTAAGGNRCSAKNPGVAAGNSCDEYPFASTVEGQQAGTNGNPTAVTRCVPAGQNSSQGGKISGIYNRVAQQGQFDIEFNFGPNNAPGTGYCAPNPNCALSGSQQVN